MAIDYADSAVKHSRFMTLIHETDFNKLQEVLLIMRIW
jgi:hypothetical protein